MGADSAAEHQLRDRTAVKAELHILHNGQYPGVWEGFDGKKFFELVDAGKGVF